MFKESERGLEKDFSFRKLTKQNIILKQILITELYKLIMQFKHISSK